MSSPPRDFPSHEVLSKLARDDPDAYEVLRREMIDSLIDNAPPHLVPRLKGLQFRIDGIRRLSKSGLGSTLKIYEMMWQSFLNLNEGWQDLVRMKAGQAAISPDSHAPVASARILHFRSRSSARAPAYHGQGN